VQYQLIEAQLGMQGIIMMQQERIKSDHMISIESTNEIVQMAQKIVGYGKAHLKTVDLLT